MTYVWTVVHHGADVVLDLARAHVVPGILVEVALEAVLDVPEVDGDEVVSVRSRLLVVETDGVADLVSDDSKLKNDGRKKRKNNYNYHGLLLRMSSLGVMA